MNHNDFLDHIFYSELPEFRLPRRVTSNETTNTDNTEDITISCLQGLIKQKRNADLKSMLLNQLPSNLINRQKSTLLHTAVIFNNIDAIALLFTLDFDINARNSFGETALLLAARKNLYQSAQLLLTLRADVFIDDFNGENALRVLLIKEKNTPTHVLGNLFERLKNSELGANGIVDILIEFNCPLEHVLLFDDAQITQEMLTRAIAIDEDTSCASLHLAMLSGNMENVRVLLQYGPYLYSRRKKFMEKVTKNILDPSTRPYFEQILNWNLAGPAFLDIVERLFRKADESIVEFLLKIGIAEYSRERHRRNLMIDLFYNKKLDVAKLLKNRIFDVNGVDAFGVTPLRRAIQRGNKAGVAYLLENGADPNLKDRSGQTPLFDCYTDGMRKLLLEAGADLFVIDNAGRTIIDKNPSELVKANYCILEAKRLTHVDAGFSQNVVLEPYREDVQWMKNRRILDSMSLFSVLAEKVEKMARYVKSKNNVAAALKAIRERELKPIYASRLKKKLREAVKMHELQVKTAEFLADLIRTIPPDHLAIEKIISFLSYQDLIVFDKIN